MKSNKIVLYYAKKYWKGEAVCALLYMFFIGLSLVGPLLMQYFIDEVIPSQKVSAIIHFAAVFLGLYTAIALVALAIKYTVVRLENKIVLDIRSKMYTNLIYQPLGYYKEHNVGLAMERLLRDTEIVHSLWGFLFPSAFSSIATFIITYAIIFSKSWSIGVCSFVTIIAYIIVFKMYNNKLRALYLDARKDVDGMSTCITDAWGGAKEIKIFGFEEKIINKFYKFITLLKRDKTEMALKNELSKQLMSMATTIGSLATLTLGGYFVLKGDLTIGMMLALQTYVIKLYAPAQDIADMAMDYKKYTVNLERISELLFLEGEDFEVGKKISEKGLKEGIKFEEVTFAYGENEVLKDINLRMPSKGVVAIVGKSGEGKSTILNLLLGFIKPKSGGIQIDNENYAEVSLKAIRNNVTLVSQDAYLFNASIYENIRIGNPEATKEEIEEIVRRLGIDKIVAHLPNKLDTVVSEFGKNLSGGQVQRISIARALLKKAPIIIFDEATSNIDSHTEEIIYEVLDEMKQEHLIILVSHRLSSLRNADQIYILDQGHIVEQGSFQALNTESDYFAKLFNRQIG